MELEGDVIRAILAQGGPPNAGDLATASLVCKAWRDAARQMVVTLCPNYRFSGSLEEFRAVGHLDLRALSKLSFQDLACSQLSQCKHLRQLLLDCRQLTSPGKQNGNPALHRSCPALASPPAHMRLLPAVVLRAPQAAAPTQAPHISPSSPAHLLPHL